MSFFQTTLIEGEILVIPPYQDKVIYLSLSKGPARQVNSLYWAHSSSGCSFNFQKLQHGLLWAHTLSFFTLLSSFPPPSCNSNLPVQLPDCRSVPLWVHKGDSDPCYRLSVLLFTRRFTGSASTHAQRVKLTPNLT